ncbi:GDSL esterase/lipase [Dorcoceras hygrometricum]|uniref:GDSL esterase/lipase n=1 Tax=Dorcoceras hygrometricum TaxID=472368 RepID=A0A2Z7BSG0_9LAMI|nr:GDSL esterase/lipase [Dorcoceras hygrometricum]
MMTSRMLPSASSTYMLKSALLISVSSNRYADLSPVDMLTPSLLLTAFSSRYADVIIADTISCATDSRLLLFIFLFDISSSRLHRFYSRSHFRMRPVLFPLKRSNEQDSLLCSELLRFWPNSFV